MGLFYVVLLLGQHTVSKLLSLDLISCATYITAQPLHENIAEVLSTNRNQLCIKHQSRSACKFAHWQLSSMLSYQAGTVVPLPPIFCTWYFRR